MTYYFVVLANRAQTMYFFRILKNYGCNVNIINTPPSISSICSISIRFDPKDFERVKKLLLSYNFSSFRGVYRYEGNGWKGSIRKVF
ncbi:MAG TPA: putative Se/S carrier-like protein [Clostridia bacterium]